MLPYGNLSMSINHFALPTHLKFVQDLACPITASLSNSCGQAMTLAELAQLGQQNLSDLGQVQLSYASLTGSEALRQEIANFHQALNHHQTILSAENVLCFCGAQEALAALYQLVLKPNDEVVVVTPNYPSLTDMAVTLGCKVKEVCMSEHNQWQLTIDDFAAQVSDKTKLIVINSPHNPTGHAIDSTLAEQILQLAMQYDCYLIADDVSQASNFKGLALSHRYLDYPKAFVVSVMSKSFGLAGLRVGWLINTDSSLLSALLAIKSYGSICCSAIDDHLALIAFKAQNEIIEKNNQLIVANIALFEQFVARHAPLFSWYPPQAGLLALVKVDLEQPIELWAKLVAQQTGLLLLPSSLFGLSGNYFRLGLGQKNFAKMLALCTEFIEQSQ